MLGFLQRAECGGDWGEQTSPGPDEEGHRRAREAAWGAVMRTGPGSSVAHWPRDLANTEVTLCASVFSYTLEIGMVLVFWVFVKIK